MENYGLAIFRNFRKYLEGFYIKERKPDNASYVESKYGVEKICFAVTFDTNKSHIIVYCGIISV